MLRRGLWTGLVALAVIAACVVAWPRRGHAADPAWPTASRAVVDPASGARYRIEQVFVPAGRDLIAAVLVRPEHDRPCTLVVTVSGSGEGLEPAEGALQRRLVAQGYAVLRLGKKGVGASSGNWRTETFEDRARNVRAALEWASTRRDLEPGNVVLYGHSQGGYVIPLVAADPRVGALILAAGSARPVRDQIADESFEVARRGGVGEVQALRQAARTRRLLDVALSACPVVAYHYLCHVYRHDPAPALAAIRKPVLALFGENDPMVPPAANLAPMRALLAAGPDARIVVLPNGNHMFWTSRTGLTDEYPRLLRPDAAFAYAEPGNADHARLGRQWANRAPYADGYFEAIEAFLVHHAPPDGA